MIFHGRLNVRFFCGFPAFFSIGCVFILANLVSITLAFEIAQLQRLVTASSLSYLELATKMRTSPYFATSGLSPISQVVDPKTQSGATIFLEKYEDKNTDESSSNPSTRIVVACRGSANIKNFATNLRLNLVPSKDIIGSPPDGKVHSGFQEAASGLWKCLAPELDIALEKIEANTKNESKKGMFPIPIIFTGHSLGGATALLSSVLCTEYYKSRYINSGENIDNDTMMTTVSDVITFGGPLLCDEILARYINEEGLKGCNIMHLVHNADQILAQNKPVWDQLGFVNTGIELQCDPFAPIIYDDNDTVPSRIPWNILDHCKYLGTFVGPRLI
mmetsp:Transcript_27960/g.31968  ORF Transcript_27960/g.31968 Transcript_27960/m.31968 type:complete len:332 (+) Transcript_27960:116-1111(+)